MPRRSLTGTGGHVLHVINRGARRLQLFDSAADYDAFLSCVREALEDVPVRLLAYCLMPNHFHLVVWPREDDELAKFMKDLTGTHATRWRAQRGTRGEGCVYQGRYRAIAVRTDSHFFALCRYVETNALRAKLVERAEHWPWSSASRYGNSCHTLHLHEWPIPPPSRWEALLNEPQPTEDIATVRDAVRREQPLGEVTWQAAAPWYRAPRGRPKKTPGEISGSERNSTRRLS